MQQYIHGVQQQIQSMQNILYFHLKIHGGAYNDLTCYICAWLCVRCMWYTHTKVHFNASLMKGCLHNWKYIHNLTILVDAAILFTMFPSLHFFCHPAQSIQLREDRGGAEALTGCRWKCCRLFCQPGKSTKHYRATLLFLLVTYCVPTIYLFMSLFLWNVLQWRQA